MYLYRPMLGKNDSIGSVSKAYTQNTRRINSTRARGFHCYKEVTEKEPTETQNRLTTSWWLAWGGRVTINRTF